MEFIKLHQHYDEVLVNTANISYIERINGNRPYKSKIYFNSVTSYSVGDVDGLCLKVNETLDEIADLINNGNQFFKD